MNSAQFAALEQAEFLKDNAVYQNAKTNYEPVIVPIEVGMPATYYVGTDSYATQVSAIEHFKSGNRAGQIKSVAIEFHGNTYTFRPKNYSYGITWKGEYSTLGLGYAEEYLDPHF